MKSVFNRQIWLLKTRKMSEPTNTKLKRKAISLETKIEILDRLRNGEGSTFVGKMFGLKESTKIICVSPNILNREPAQESKTDKIKKLQEALKTANPTEFLSTAGEAALSRVNHILCLMLETFCSKFPIKSVAENHFPLIKSLYYYLLDKIIKVEKNNKPHVDIKILVETDIFHKALIACCVEIILDSYGYEEKFPWILNCFNIDAFSFCKIIELIVARHDNLLNRMHIKHLTSIEEICLERLAWQKTSCLWVNFENKPLPAWSDVDFSRTCGSHVQALSPMNSAFETFHSVITNESARRDLFNTSQEQLNAEHIILNGTESVKQLSSLRIFLRKFYKLAWIRMKEMCKELFNGDSNDCLKKIWTLFEYSITQKTELMQDRHLDQIIMCAIYIYVKVTDIRKKFIDIMKVYRKQPQADSSIYREVLIEKGNGESISTYKDIIYFYNTLYVQNMTDYALTFSNTRVEINNIQLSPHPDESLCVPKQISSTHKFFVSPMDKLDIRHSPDSLIYGIGTSPAKDLQRMNDAVKKGKRNLPFNDESSVNDNKVPRLTSSHLSKVQDILLDRRSNGGQHYSNI